MNGSASGNGDNRSSSSVRWISPAGLQEEVDDGSVNKSSSSPQHRLLLGELCDLRTARSLVPSSSGSKGTKLRVGNEEPLPVLAVGVVLMYASFNRAIHQDRNAESTKAFMTLLAESVTPGLDCQRFATSVQVDSDDASLRLCIGDDDDDQKDDDQAGQQPHHRMPLPPGELPCLAIVVQDTSVMEHSVLKYVSGIRSNDIMDALTGRTTRRNVSRAAKRTMEQFESEFDMRVSPRSCSDAVRIFVAGDRSSVGKSSVCLGILGTLLTKLGYDADELGYIKPATQSESTQLIQLYCEKHGIDCRPVGPLVYYRGFTRAFLAGETDSTEQLLEACGNAVDRIARSKRVVLVDGVGFPAVGSICGTDNASVARACSYPYVSGKSGGEQEHGRKTLGVVIVGGSGVGGAVDAFNLNATYFDKANVPVMGAIFNKLSETGFYALESCKREVSSYFAQSEEQRSNNRRPFGFVPVYQGIAGKDGMRHVDDYIRVFGENVDVPAIIDAAKAIKESSAPAAPASVSGTTGRDLGQVDHNPPKRRRKMGAADVGQAARLLRTRDQIEKEAILAGAAPSA